MRTIVLIILMILTASVNCLWSQQNNSQAPSNTDEKAVTLTLKETPLPTALNALFKGSGLTYGFAKQTGENSGNEWWNKVTVSVNINNVPFRDAVKIVARAAGLNVIINSSLKQTGIEQQSSLPEVFPGQTDYKDTNGSVMQQPRHGYIFTPIPYSSNQMVNRKQTQQEAMVNGPGMQQGAQYSANLNSINMTAKESKSGKLLKNTA